MNDANTVKYILAEIRNHFEISNFEEKDIKFVCNQDFINILINLLSFSEDHSIIVFIF